MIQPGATTRKGSLHADRQNSGVPYYADDDEDANRKKYTRRGNVFFIKIKLSEFVNNDST